jgi:multidrug efflux pump subunit AcrA (membrane-fusion protein)
MIRLNVVRVLAVAAVVAGNVLSAAVVTAGAAYVAFQYTAAKSLPEATPAAPESRPRVDVVYPSRAALAHRFHTNATLEAFEDADLFAEISGYLSQVRVDIGDHVKAGQILAVIDVPETEAALAESECPARIPAQAAGDRTSPGRARASRSRTAGADIQAPGHVEPEGLDFEPGAR